MKFYLISIPIVLIYYTIAAGLSKKANDDASFSFWFFVLLVWNGMGIWPFVCRYSKNLLFDSMLFDMLILLAYYVTLVYLGSAKTFSIYQWVACALMMIGIVLFKAA